MIKYLFILLLSPLCCFSKTLVFTTYFNRPDFVELQHKLFEKFLEDDYEFWVISDANTPARREAGKKMCEKLNISFIQVPQEIHDWPYLPRLPNDNLHQPNHRHCNAVQWAWDNYFSHHNGPVMLIDSDMFLIRPFSVEKTLENKHFAGVFWGTDDMVTGEKKSYLWLALILFNNPILPEKETICFNCGYLPGTKAVCDSGGCTNIYLTKHKDILNVQKLSFDPGYKFYCPYQLGNSNPPNNSQNLSAAEITQKLRERKFTEAEIRLALKKPYTIELLGSNHFLHYRAGSNYEGYSNEYLAKKDQILLGFFDELLSSKVEDHSTGDGK